LDISGVRYVTSLRGSINTSAVNMGDAQEKLHATKFRLAVDCAFPGVEPVITLREERPALDRDSDRRSGPHW
jgi:hypothetical protein